MAADPVTSATVDEILNFDSTDDENSFNDNPSRRTKRKDEVNVSSKRKADAEPNDNLGVQNEVKISKKRKAIAKLDEERLLSAPGIPKLRADARKPNFLTKTLRIKGKGHEFSDVAMLLNYYQLWLDELYPRAKFGDGLQLLEKAGHSRRMQVMRKEWIDEGKPEYIREREARKKAIEEMREQEKTPGNLFAGEEALMSGANNESADGTLGVEEDSLFVPDSRLTENIGAGDDGLPDDDELDALIAEQDTRPVARPASKQVVDDDSEGDDDLDALLAEQETRRLPISMTGTNSASRPKTSPFEDNDEDMDDLDALLAEQETRLDTNSTQQIPARHLSMKQTEPPTVSEDEDLIGDDDDDFDALIAAEEEQITSTKLAPLSPLERSKITSSDTNPVHHEGVDVAADGADMFSSSPVRGPAPSSLLPDDGTHGPEPTLPPLSTDSRSREIEDAHSADDKLDAVREGNKEDSQGSNADDMFSSSPVQND